MNIKIKEKWKLIDLATRGTEARKHVTPSVLIADAVGGKFFKGDMLDANATYNLIQQYGGKGGDDGDCKYNILVVTQELYDSMESHDPNTIYFLIESIPAESWSFGDNFPIKLN